MFCPLIPEKWSNKIREACFNPYQRNYIYDKGLLPFADYSDWGATCFNLNERQQNGEYEIVIWDHERPNDWEHLADDLVEMFANILSDYQKMQEGAF